MVNFLKETIEALKEHNLTLDDVKVLYANTHITKENFIEIADFYYDDSYGTAYIQGWYLLGDGFWFSRGEYDGLEWWELNKMPIIKDSKEVVIVKERWHISVKPKEEQDEL